MQSPVVFERPLLLLLIPIFWLAFWAISQRSRAPLAADQRRQSLVVRVIVSTIILLALAQPTWHVLSGDLTTIFVLDSSESMRPDQRAAANRYIQKAIDSKGDDDDAGLVVFGKVPNLEVTPTDDPVIPASHAPVPGDATNIQYAVQAAESAFPPGMGKKIVLLTDGKENAGDLLAEIGALKAANVVVDVAPVGIKDTSASAPEAGIDGMRIPQRVDKDAPFPIRVVIDSNVPQTSKLHITHDGGSFADETVSLKAGKNVVVLDGRETTSGTHRYDAQITPQYDTLSQNNQAFAITEVHDRPRVLYIADSADPGMAGLAHALGAQGIDVQTADPHGVPTDQTGWNGYDSVILSNVAAAELTPAQHLGIQQAVKTFGVGLGMIGGVNSFGAGGYAGTPVETALPVTMQVPQKEKIPAADIVVVLDASGSMGAEEDGVEKVQLAARAAVNLMKALTPEDRVAVIAVTTEPTIVVPLESPSQAELAQSQIESLEAGGGGIYCHTGLVAAYDLLSTSKAPIKHVIMCADTSDSEEQEGCIQAATDAYNAQHITTTCYGIGLYTDDDVPFQKQVAAAGHGDFAAVENASDLPQLYKRDAQRIQRAEFIEHPFRPTYLPSDPVTLGVPFASEPPLLGYNLVTPKPGVTQPLTAPKTDDTIFAYWQYGLGRSFAFTSDDRAHWAVGWLGWPGYNRFWAQAIRWTLRSQSQAGLQAVADNESGTGHVVADAFSASGGFVNNAPITATVVAPDESETEVTLEQTAPGRYEANFDAGQIGVYAIYVRDGSRPGVAQTVDLSVPYSPEFRIAPPNISLLTAVVEATGGRFEKSAADVFSGNPLWTVSTVGLTPFLLVLAGFLFVLDIAWRRLGLRIKIRLPASGDPAGTLAAGAPGASAPAAAQEPHRREPAIARPTIRESYENEVIGQYLGRRLQVDETGHDDGAPDPFPQVATTIKRPRSKLFDEGE